MTTIGEMVSEKTSACLAKETVQIGDVYLMKMDSRNGIVPKTGDSYRDKFFIVLGFDNKGNIYGGVIINSRINPYMIQTVQDWHYPIRCSKYSFLKHDSYVDCSKLKIAFPSKFSVWEYKGAINKDDLELIIGALKSSPNETKERLSLFNL